MTHPPLRDMFPVPLTCRKGATLDGPADETIKPKPCVTMKIFLSSIVANAGHQRKR